MKIVEAVRRIQEPFKNANRKFHPLDTVIPVGGAVIGGGSLTLIAGPCSVESEEQIISVARDVKASGAQILRGGAFKPRTSPYAFLGMREEGIKLLLEAKKDTGLPVVTVTAPPKSTASAEDRLPAAADWDFVDSKDMPLSETFAEKSGQEPVLQQEAEKKQITKKRNLILLVISAGIFILMLVLSMTLRLAARRKVASPAPGKTFLQFQKFRNLLREIRRLLR